MADIPKTRVGIGTEDTMAAPPESAETLPAPRTAGEGDAGELPLVDPRCYELGPELARGGMGRIRSAEDKRLGRPVALKELLAPDQERARRFCREALITARLEHPAIVSVHEAGRWPSGEPFYAMKLVQGRSLDKVVHEAATVDERLALLPNVIAVVEALAYAHERRIIHGDLKPANVLVGAFGETVVIDWGLAKDLRAGEEPAPAAAALGSPTPAAGTTHPEMTVEGSVMGTPGYMAPEQAAGEHSKIDERTDVYSLGAILYHVLAGAPPYAGRNSAEVLARVLSGPPEPLADRAPGVPGDLLTIVEKAMADRPGNRYPSARELAADLRRFQHGQLVAAHLYSRAELVIRWLRRHRAPVAIAAAALAVLAVVGVVSVRRVVVERDRADRERALAESRRVEAQEQSRRATARADELTLMQARTLVAGDATLAVATLRGLSEGSPSWGVARTIASAARARGLARVFEGHTAAVTFVGTAPDGTIASTSADGTIRLWDAARGSARVLRGHTDYVTCLAFSADGRWAASGGYDRSIRVWDVARGAVTRELDGHTDHVLAVEFSADGRHILSLGADKTARLWDVAAGTSVVFAEGKVEDAGFLADGGVATAARDGLIRLATTGGAVRRVLAGHRGPVWRILVEEGAVLSGGEDRTVRRWDLATGQGRVLGVHPGPVTGLAASGDGTRLAAITGKTLRLWSLARDAPAPARDLAAHAEDVTGALFSPDGARLVSLSPREVVVWDVASARSRALPLAGVEVTSAAFGDGGLLVTGGGDHRVRLWALAAGEPRLLSNEAGEILHLAVAPDGRQVAIGGRDGKVRLVDLATAGARVLCDVTSDPPACAHQGAIEAIAFAPDGKHLVSASADRTLDYWEIAGGKRVILTGHDDLVAAVAFSPDGAHLASAGHDHTVRLWDPAAGTGRVLGSHDDFVTRVAFSPDGRMVASAGDDKTIRLWPVGGGPPQVLPAFGEALTDLAFSPDGRQLAAAGRDKQVCVVDVASGQVRPLGRHEDLATDVAFAPDGRLMASASYDGVVRLWDPAGGGAPRDLRGHTAGVTTLAFSPDGRTLASGGYDHGVRLWDVASGESRLLEGHRDAVTDLAFTPDGKSVISASRDGTLYAWPDDLPHDPAALRAWLAR